MTEATAPCRVELAGGVEGAPSVAVAIDRRAWCAVETLAAGVEIESRDLLRKVEGRDVAEVLEKGAPAPVARVLSDLGVRTGVRVVTQSRVPEGAGLGESEALAAAVAGAVARVVGLGLERADAARAAVLGGVVVHDGDGSAVQALAVDPARVEESFLLFDVGGGGPARPARREADVVRDVAGRLKEALLARRFDDVIALWAEEWQARARIAAWPEEASRAAEVLREAGGGARLCGAGSGRILAAWAPPGARGPGRREAVAAASRAAGLRLFPARVDLRGIEVE